MKAREAVNLAKLVILAFLAFWLIHAVWATGNLGLVHPPEGEPDLSVGDRVLAEHADDCWVAVAPTDMAGKIPGHVIVQIPGERVVYSKALVGPALDLVFGNGHADLRVIAFCR